ncbi:MAG TPA: YeeE/YedE thiosulfate transporter family protein, partial [Burkholderiales bacterium]|nr:YeeE/YedE thiosulfate transporter family protein [Burkholderiales bacterium]
GGALEMRIDSGFATLAAAGLLVGVGTSYGSGCTSGHGVCGVSRLSPRSLMATAAFMLAGFATVFVARHVLA